ncbi:MAG: HEPN domain-containing protein [Armatimonadota bacterium]
MSDGNHEETTGANEWLKFAKRDLDAARSLFAGGDYAWMLVTCQQAVEKLLKGAIITRTQQKPPRTHNLVQLAKRTGLEFEEKQMELMRELGIAYIESRYPATSAGEGDLTVEQAMSYLSATREVCEWLLRRIR